MSLDTDRAFKTLLCTLELVRSASVDTSDCHFYGVFGSVQGQLSALESLDLISSHQFLLLTDLLLNASKHRGKPFPSAKNVGPVMPFWIALERSYLLVKPSAQVLANEPEQVSAPAAFGSLRLLCLLVTSRTGETRSLPVHTLRPMPPAVVRTGRWLLASDPAFVLRETQVVRPSTTVLERYSRQRQANAVCADSRAVRTGGVSYVR